MQYWMTLRALSLLTGLIISCVSITSTNGSSIKAVNVKLDYETVKPEQATVEKTSATGCGATASDKKEPPKNDKKKPPEDKEPPKDDKEEPPYDVKKCVFVCDEWACTAPDVTKSGDTVHCTCVKGHNECE